MAELKELIGKRMKTVEQVGRDEIVFTLKNGKKYRLYHDQSCCESVTIDDVAGDLKDLVGPPILKAEESTSENNPPGVDKGYQESFTWTFYHFATVNGYVTIRWYGSSNGYYSERVDFAEME